jgi:hypothetical protein
MGVPTDRRILYGVSVVPQISYTTTNTSETMEEGYTVGTPSHTNAIYKVDTITNTATGESLKYLGGKSSGTDHVQVTHDQGTDEWTSMHHKDQIWENSDDIGSYGVKLALEGDEYDILIPAGGSVCMRVNDSVVTDARNVKLLRSTSNNSQIEFIIAK